MNDYAHIPSEEARERELAYLATQLAEKQLRDGTAKAQVITHYLQVASPREQIERRALEAKIRMLEAQIASMHNEIEVRQMIVEAMEAFKEYRGEDSDEELY